MPFLRRQHFHEVWDEYLDHLIRYADGFKGWIEECYTVAPRGKKTYELLGQGFRVEDLRSNILVNTGRDLNYRFMVAEFLWIASGRNDVASLARYNKKMAEYSDDGVTLYGAYGPRLMAQWQRIMEVLARDPDTRQAVSVIFDRDLKPTKDTPCTISLEWLLRDKKLNCIVTMRSSDIWLGLAYDFYTFSQLTNCLAGYLGVETGWLQMQLGSLHLYQEHLDIARNCYNWKSYTLLSSALPGFPPQRMEELFLNPRPTVPDTHPHEPWGTLARVLQQPSKAHALGILKESHA